MYIANEVADEVMQDSKYDSVKAPLQKDFEAIPELTGEQFENKPLSQKDNSGPPIRRYAPPATPACTTCVCRQQTCRTLYFETFLQLFRNYITVFPFPSGYIKRVFKKLLNCQHQRFEI